MPINKKSFLVIIVLILTPVRLLEGEIKNNIKMRENEKKKIKFYIICSEWDIDRNQTRSLLSFFLGFQQSSNLLDLPSVPLQTLQQLTSTITSRGEVTRFICVPALPIAIGLCIIYRLVIASLVLMVERPKRGAFGLCSFPALFFTPRSVVFNVALGAWIDCALFHDTLWGCQKS